MQKLLLTLILALSLPLFLSLPAGQAGAQTLSDLESRIAALLAEIQTLQTELQTLQQTSSFTTTLGKGSEGTEVIKLQQYLAKDPSLYPEAVISGYYGALTESAVKRFQQKHNIVSSGTPATTGYGTVGPKTRATLNSLLTVVSPIGPSYGSPTPTPTPVVSTATPNRSPNLSITGSRFITLPNKATLSAIATDDGKPSATLTYLWSKAGGPGTVTFSAPTNKETTATFSSAGTYQIMATVSDSDLFASFTLTLIVSPSSTIVTTTPPATTTPTLPAPTLTFSASQTTLTKGNSTTLTWSSANALSCTASNGWSGSKTASGSATLTPQTTTTYTLSCKGGAGLPAGQAGDTVTKSVTVAVTGTSPAPIAGADLNGYVAEYECRKGNPNCDVDVEGLAVKSCDATITTADSFDTIQLKLNDTSDINRDDSVIICVNPGDYRSKGTEESLLKWWQPQISIHTDGTAGVRRVFRLAANSDYPWRLPIEQQAIFRKIDVDGNYWILHRLSFHDNNEEGGGVRIGSEKDVTDVIVDQIFAEENRALFATGDFNKRITVQNSLFRRNPWQGYAGQDSQCIRVENGNVDFHAVNNEAYDCGDSVLLQGPAISAFDMFPGTVIENNDLYQTPYSYCDSGGTPNSSGEFSAGENAIDIKSGGIANNIIKVINNRTWGFKFTATSCASTGSGGESIVVHGGSRHVLIKNNIISDAPSGLSTSNPESSEVSFVGNLLWNIAGSALSDIWKSNNDEFYYNTFINTSKWISSGGSEHDAQCNVLINAGLQDSGAQADYNTYYNTPGQLKNPGTHDLVFSATSQSQNTEYCFYRKLLTSPERVCIPYAKTTTASPHYNQCAAGVGQRAGIGINDKIWTWADTLFTF